MIVENVSQKYISIIKVYSLSYSLTKHNLIKFSKTNLDIDFILGNGSQYNALAYFGLGVDACKMFMTPTEGRQRKKSRKTDETFNFEPHRHTNSVTASQHHHNNSITPSHQHHSNIDPASLVVHNIISGASHNHNNIVAASQHHNNIVTASQHHNNIVTASQHHNNIVTASQHHSKRANDDEEARAECQPLLDSSLTTTTTTTAPVTKAVTSSTPAGVKLINPFLLRLRRFVLSKLECFFG